MLPANGPRGWHKTLSSNERSRSLPNPNDDRGVLPNGHRNRDNDHLQPERAMSFYLSIRTLSPDRVEITDEFGDYTAIEILDIPNLIRQLKAIYDETQLPAPFTGDPHPATVTGDSLDPDAE